MNLLADILIASWHLFQMAAPYFLLGLLIAAVLHAYVRASQIAKYLGKPTVRSIFLASLLGVPLPLCSCGVVPAAMSLRKQGASKAATVSFLISTPESGIDSIAVTYGLLGPLMAFIRPLAAFLTAFAAGLAVQFGDPSANIRSLPHAAPAARMGLRAGFAHAFGTLLADIAPWYLFGMLLGGALDLFVPADLIADYLGGGWQSLLLMLALGIPMYICASASTPIAASLMLKGLSPGAALVFLLAGPATNLSIFPTLTKFLGIRAVLLYLAAIIVVTFALGLLTDALLAPGAILARFAPIAPHEHLASGSIWPLVSSIALLLLMARSLWAKHRRPA